MTTSFNYVPGTERAWLADAKCRDLATTPDMYPNALDAEAVEEAKTFCGGCPVRNECLREALTRGERYGIWGGLDFTERTSVKRHRSRQSLKSLKAKRDREAGAA